MLFLRRQWPGLADGSITPTFRSWKRPQARAGGTALTPVGVLAIESVDVVPVASITDEEARRAGHADRAALGRERAPFKADVRRLKALGLTESLEVGYRLSPRGRAVLAGPDGPGPLSPG